MTSLRYVSTNTPCKLSISNYYNYIFTKSDLNLSSITRWSSPFFPMLNVKVFSECCPVILSLTIVIVYFHNPSFLLFLLDEVGSKYSDQRNDIKFNILHFHLSLMKFLCINDTLILHQHNSPCKDLYDRQIHIDLQLIPTRIQMTIFDIAAVKFLWWDWDN